MNREAVEQVGYSSSKDRGRFQRVPWKHSPKKFDKGKGRFHTKVASATAVSPFERWTKARTDYALARKRFAKLQPRPYKCGPKEMASFMDCSPIFVIARHLRSFVPKRFWLSVKMKKGSFFFNSNVLGSLPAFQADTLRQAMLMGLLSYQAVKVHILSTKPKDFRYFTFRAAFVEDFVLDLFKDESLHDFFKLRALFADDEQRRRYLKRLAVAKAADPRYFFTTRQRWNKEKFFRSS